MGSNKEHASSHVFNRCIDRPPAESESRCAPALSKMYEVDELRRQLNQLNRIKVLVMTQSGLPLRFFSDTQSIGIEGVHAFDKLSPPIQSGEPAMLIDRMIELD